MGKSAVLKDMKGTPMGYLRKAEGGVVCRAAVDQPAQALLIFADGTQAVFALEPGRREQLLACAEGQIACACVFRQEELLLATDDAARQRFYAMRSGRKNERREAAQPPNAEQSKPAEAADGKTPGKTAQKTRLFPAQRWPPPPCWDEAVYDGGRWTDEMPPES